MVLNQPLVAHGVGDQDVDDLVKLGAGTVDQSRSWVFTNTVRGSPFQPTLYRNNFSGSKGT
jgi:hypothetical protein